MGRWGLPEDLPWLRNAILYLLSVSELCEV